MTSNVAMTRHEVRECAFLILFEMTFREDEPVQEMYELAEEHPKDLLKAMQKVKNYLEK